jgi:protocatechuate 3,4-dioxygenase alpha subunit
MTTPATASQTVGPYFKIGLSPLYCRNLAGADTPGERVTIQGKVLDGEGNPIPDAVLEIWQADAKGKYPAGEAAEVNETHGGFSGFGRIPTDGDGVFRFSTIKPGSVAGPDGSEQAPHIVVSVFMRGLLTRLVTRIYFLGEAKNEADPVLQLVDKERRATLLAAPVEGQTGLLEWNIHLQGKNETVFFEF